jgi:hypothetical protein
VGLRSWGSANGNTTIGLVTVDPLSAGTTIVATGSAASAASGGGGNYNNHN